MGENSRLNETATRNGHDGESNVKINKVGNKTIKEKLNRSQKNITENISTQVFKNRSKSIKVEVKEEKSKVKCEIKKEGKKEITENVILDCGLKNSLIFVKKEIKSNVKDNV